MAVHEQVAPVERGGETSCDQVDVAAGSALSAEKDSASRFATGSTAARRAGRTRSLGRGSPSAGGIWADRPNSKGWAFDPKTPISTASG